MSEVPVEDPQLLNVELNESLDRCRALIDEYRDVLGGEEGDPSSDSNEPSVPRLEAGSPQQL